MRIKGFKVCLCQLLLFILHLEKEYNDYIDMKSYRYLASLILFVVCVCANAQSLRLYKFNENTKGKKEPFSTTRTVKTYPIGYVWREGSTNPSFTFTPHNKKWYYVTEVNNGDTINTYIKRSNIIVTEYKTSDIPLDVADRKFFGDGTTIRIMALNKAGHSIKNLPSNTKYVMEINVGYYAFTYPLVVKDGVFKCEEIGAEKIIVDDVYGRVFDRYGKLRWDAKCVANDAKPVVYYLPEHKAIYIDGKIMRLQK